VRQDDSNLRRRWFQDDYFDLFVWSRADGDIVAFQLSYDRSGREQLLGWHRDRGYMHRRVDSGEAWPQASRTPLLVACAGRFPRQRVLAEFDARSQAVDPRVRALVREKAAHYVSSRRQRRL
jgi:hypothetical protein